MRYGRARHYLKRLNGKPQFEYHQQSIEYLQRKLSEESSNDKVSISSEAPLNNEHIVHHEHTANDELQNKAQNSLDSKNRAWASSSVRIEHQPPKLGVEGSNPTPPATNNPLPFVIVLLQPHKLKKPVPASLSKV